jgi:DNA-binding protein H-NS
MSGVDLNGLSVMELEALLASAGKMREQKLRDNLAAVRQKIVQAAKDEGYSIAELFGAVSGGSGKQRAAAKGKGKGQAKFANPTDPSQTWTGRGKRPGWFKLALERGVQAASMAI